MERTGAGGEKRGPPESRPHEILHYHSYVYRSSGQATLMPEITVKSEFYFEKPGDGISAGKKLNPAGIRMIHRTHCMRLLIIII